MAVIPAAPRLGPPGGSVRFVDAHGHREVIAVAIHIHVARGVALGRPKRIGPSPTRWSTISG